MSKRERPLDHLDVPPLEPPPKKQRSIEPQSRFVWFNKVPSSITIHLLQQHLWSKYRLNAQPQLKTTINSQSYFFIEIDTKRGDELMQQSPICIKGHSIILANAYEAPSNMEKEELKTMHEPNAMKYRILVSNVPGTCIETDLEQIFNKYGSISTVRCDDNKLCKTATIDFDEAESLVNVANDLATDSLKLQQEILEVIIDTETAEALHRMKQKKIICALIKLNFMKPITDNKALKLLISFASEDEDASICEDEISVSEMSISPNIATADIKLMENTPEKEEVPLESSTEPMTKKEINETQIEDMDANDVIEDNDDDDDDDDDSIEDDSDDDISVNEELLSSEERRMLKEYKQNLEARDLELKTLRNTLKMEEIECNEWYKKLQQHSESTEDEESKMLFGLYDEERKMNGTFLSQERELQTLLVALDKMEQELKDKNNQIASHKLNEKQQQIRNTKECDEWNRDRLKYQKQMDVLNKSNNNLKDTIDSLKAKSETIAENIEAANNAKKEAHALCAEQEDELKRSAEKLKQSKTVMELDELNMKNKIQLMKSNVEIEKTKHAKSKLLLKQTINGIQENLIKINNQNKVKDNLIFGLQKQLQHYQAQYPYLMTL